MGRKSLFKYESFIIFFSCSKKINFEVRKKVQKSLSGAYVHNIRGEYSASSQCSRLHTSKLTLDTCVYNKVNRLRV